MTDPNSMEELDELWTVWSGHVQNGAVSLADTREGEDGVGLAL